MVVATRFELVTPTMLRYSSVVFMIQAQATKSYKKDKRRVG